MLSGLLPESAPCSRRRAGQASQRHQRDCCGSGVGSCSCSGSSPKAKRVEVPFDTIAPNEDQFWKGSTADDVAKEVAIYRAHKASPVVIATDGELYGHHQPAREHFLAGRYAEAVQLFSRLLEQEGIFYFFKHEASKHTEADTASKTLLKREMRRMVRWGRPTSPRSARS